MQEAHLIPNPILKVLSTLSCHIVRHLLIGGQACVLYGAAEFSRDCDVIILADDRMDGNSGKHVQHVTNWGYVPPGLQPSVYGSRIGRSLIVILDRIPGDSSGFTSEIAFTAE
jgi:hypothetical protein